MAVSILYVTGAADWLCGGVLVLGGERSAETINNSLVDTKAGRVYMDGLGAGDRRDGAQADSCASSTDAWGHTDRPGGGWSFLHFSCRLFFFSFFLGAIAMLLIKEVCQERNKFSETGPP